MKKALFFIPFLLLALFSSCASSPSETVNTLKEDENVLIAYFSATGNTERIANEMQDILGSDIFEIVPSAPYTSDDLNYRDNSSRANREQNDPSSRPEIENMVDLSGYDTIILGYPIWHAQAPKIIYTFLESYDLSGKTIVPFCTSGGSGLGSSARNLHSSAPSSTWTEGARLSPSSNRSAITSFLEAQGL